MPPKLTPMLEQYFEIKRQVPDAILFYRLGDFYEMFYEDAERAAPSTIRVSMTTSPASHRAKRSFRTTQTDSPVTSRNSASPRRRSSRRCSTRVVRMIT